MIKLKVRWKPLVLDGAQIGLVEVDATMPELRRDALVAHAYQEVMQNYDVGESINSLAAELLKEWGVE